MGGGGIGQSSLGYSSTILNYVGGGRPAAHNGQAGGRSPVPTTQSAQAANSIA